MRPSTQGSGLIRGLLLLWHLTFNEATSTVDSAFPKRDAQTKRLSKGMELTVGMSRDSKHSLHANLFS